jgi:hypothetical protein
MRSISHLNQLLLLFFRQLLFVGIDDVLRHHPDYGSGTEKKGIIDVKRPSLKKMSEEFVLTD